MFDVSKVNQMAKVAEKTKMTKFFKISEMEKR